ncbi:MAG: MFS transporter, partial [Bacteroidota bacterium]
PEISQADDHLMYYHYSFLFVFFMYFLAAPIINPTVNQFLKNRYRHENFGKLFSYASILNRSLTFIATFVFGLLLDCNNFAFTFIYPVIGILGIFSMYLLSFLDINENIEFKPKSSFFTGVKNSILRMYYLLKYDKPYFFFQVGFMLYGIAFMLTYSVVNIFFEDGVHLNYSSVAFYKNLSVILAILFLPVSGKLIGKIDPRKFGVITFAFLSVYLSFITLSCYFPAKHEVLGVQIIYMMVIAFIFNGLFASTMHLLWSIGSAYFCKKEDAGIYQSVHLSLTGTRALFAPMAGIILYRLTGFSFTFITGVFLIIIGILLLIWSQKKHRINIKS